MTTSLRWLFPAADLAPRATLAVRLVVGFTFISSGLIKFLFENQGELRFSKLGLPAPEALAYFVGGTEVIAGILLLIGAFTRLAALPLAIDMLVAIVVSKLPFLSGPGLEPIAALPKVGFWAFAYQSRLDLSMLGCVVFLAAVGAGAWSVDAWMSRKLALSGTGA